MESIGAFPLDGVVFSKYVELFQAMKSQVVIFLPVIFIGRILLSLSRLEAPSSYVELIQDTIVAFVLLYFFVDIITFSMKIPSMLGAKLGTMAEFDIKTKDSSLPFLINLTCYLTIVLYWLCFIIYVFFLGLLMALAAWIIMAGTMFRMHSLLRAFFVLIGIVSLWPVVWYAINMALKECAKMDNSFVNTIFICTANILKCALPLWASAKMIQNPFTQNAMRAKNSLSPIKSVGGAALGGVSRVGSFLGGQSYMNSISDKIETSKIKARKPFGRVIPSLAGGLKAGGNVMRNQFAFSERPEFAKSLADLTQQSQSGGPSTYKGYSPSSLLKPNILTKPGGLSDLYRDRDPNNSQISLLNKTTAASQSPMAKKSSSAQPSMMGSLVGSNGQYRSAALSPNFTGNMVKNPSKFAGFRVVTPKSLPSSKVNYDQVMKNLEQTSKNLQRSFQRRNIVSLTQKFSSFIPKKRV